MHIHQGGGAGQQGASGGRARGIQAPSCQGQQRRRCSSEGGGAGQGQQVGARHCHCLGGVDGGGGGRVGRQGARGSNEHGACAGHCGGSGRVEGGSPSARQHCCRGREEGQQAALGPSGQAQHLPSCQVQGGVAGEGHAAAGALGSGCQQAAGGDAEDANARAQGEEAPRRWAAAAAAPSANGHAAAAPHIQGPSCHCLCAAATPQGEQPWGAGQQAASARGAEHSQGEGSARGGEAQQAPSGSSEGGASVHADAPTPWPCLNVNAASEGAAGAAGADGQRATPSGAQQQGRASATGQQAGASAASSSAAAAQQQPPRAAHCH